MKVIMPQIGMTMQEGAITKWLKADGDKVEKGEPLFEIMTEKLENQIESVATGTLKIYREADPDEFITCGEEIAEIIEE